jgi:acetyl-CoA carboxylase biotin carboxyl carrier protein
MVKIEAKSEVTGAVWKIVTKPGDRVAEGDALMIVESMKMEIPVLAEEGGTVAEILVSEGQPVSEGQTVALLER